MSTEMASALCVGTPASSNQASQIADHSQQLIVAHNSLETSRNFDDKNDERNPSVNNDFDVLPDMDFVNGPNPWLPAYGFQLQQHSQHFQPTHEDSRANDTALVQQGDFLETILEETSDDLQSDSDRSGTTYWLGSESETESVIHIKANQRAAEERPDGSGSECNSVVPKKRRRRNASRDRDGTIILNEEHWTSPRSSRSSESSSRSSSLLQFESLERTCATVSPSGYSYDSLEYSNRTNSHFENTSPDSLEEDCDDEETVVETRNSRLNGIPASPRNGFGTLRPYKSFESLDTCHKNEIQTSHDLSNGFSASFHSKTSNDLSVDGRRNDRGQRDFWHGSENYEEEEYEYEDEEDDDDDDEDTIVNRETRIYDPYDEHSVKIGLSNFVDSNLSNYSTSLDFRNTIDLREIGLEPKRDAVYDLKSGQASSLCALGNSASSRLLQTTRLNIAGVEDGCGLSTGYSGSNMAANGLNGSGTQLQHHHHHHHQHHPPRHHHPHHSSAQNDGGWSSDSSGFNFRFTDKSRSAPSLASNIEQSTSGSYAFSRTPRSSDYHQGPSIGTVSSTSLFENYTRVASLPVDLNICGIDEGDKESRENDEEDVTITNENVDDIFRSCDLRIHNEMADDSLMSGQSSMDGGSSKSSERTDSSLSSPSSTRQRAETSDESSETIGKSCVRTPSVRTQVRPEIIEVKCKDESRDRILSTKIDKKKVARMDSEDSDDEIGRSTGASDQEDTDIVSKDEIEARSLGRDSEAPRTTVKTQDRGGNVLEMAMAIENDIDAVVDEAIRQFKREVEEATGAAGNNTAALAMEAMQKLSSEKQQQLRRDRRVKNNASYELAQQFEVDEKNFHGTGRMSSCVEDDVEQVPPSSPDSNARRRVVNNASYELAQQTDYIRILQSNARPFQRMDACDERPEVPRAEIACGVKVADLVREMGADPGTSRVENSVTSDYRCPAVDKNLGRAQTGPYHDNNAFQGAKHYEVPDQQQDSMIGQIKKNSDLFSLYGESGKGAVRTLGSVEGDNDDEVDYPCLEIKSIMDKNEIIDVDKVPKPLRRTRSNDRIGNVDPAVIKTQIDAESLPERGLSFLGDFYPETKSHLVRGENSSGRSREYEKLDRDVFIDSGEGDGSLRSDKTIGKTKNERTGREPAGECPSRLEKQQYSSASSPSSSPTPSPTLPSVSDRQDGGERGTVAPFESVAIEPTVSALVLPQEGRGSSTNDSGLEKEKEAKRRKEERAYVETGKASPIRAASCVHAVTPATSSPPLAITTESVCVGDRFEKNGKEIRESDGNETESVVARREYKNNEEDNKEKEEEEQEEEEKEVVKKAEYTEPEKIDNTTKTTRNKAMSATAAKRLAMGSGPPRNNNEHTMITTKNEFGQQKNIKPLVSGSPVNERKKGGLGGFLQRFSRLRFSGRSKVPRSEITKKMNPENTPGVVADSTNPNKRTTGVKLMDEQPGTTRRKNEPDYIIIPLHAPEDELRKAGGHDEGDFEMRNKPRRSTDLERSASCVSPNGRPPVSSKPPLPPSHHQQSSGGGGSGGGGVARNIGASTPTTRCASAAGVVGNPRRRAATDLGSPAAIEMAKARAMLAAQEPRPVGLLETDLDAAEPAVRHVNLSTINGASATGHPVNSTSHITTSNNQAGKNKTRSLLNLNHTSGRQGRDGNHHLTNENELRVPHSPGSGSRNISEHHQDHHNSVGNQRPHKSMEFLLDKENLHFVKPPENELQKVGERVPSEHELRVQRSLQRLNVPDWYKNSPAARDGFRLKRHSDASQHGGWRSLGSKTTSLSSLSSSSNRQPTTGVLLSPSPTPPVFSRWSTSLLNSAGSSPASSARSSFNHRQPYLGWRSQERLANPRTPAERLAQGILPQLQSTKKQQQQQQQTNQQLEVRNSIKEVTSAIVHYVQSGQEVAGGGRLSPRPRPDDWDERGGARSTSPRGSVKLCWMESSFVGSRPVDSPETPMSLATDTECCAGCNATGTESCSCVDSATSGLYLDLTPTRDEPQPGHPVAGGKQQHQQHGSRSQCPSPSSTLNYHQPVQQYHYHPQQHHHHHQHHQHQQQQHQQQHYQRHHRRSGQSEDEEAMATAALLRNKPSPGSTTLEDVLDSLLGLPSASRTPSPGPGPISGSTSIRHHRTSNTGSSAGQTTNTNAGKSCSDLRQDLQESVRGDEDDSPVANEVGRASSYYVGELVRRKSEGSDIVPPNRSSSRASNFHNRRVSFDAAQNTSESNVAAVKLGEKLVKCRNNKCHNATTIAEARRVYKSCHNCTCLYCSRECRRAHWQRHRRTCLHSRAGTLCRQVLSSAKEDPATLRHISALAQRGYASHGRGAVKCFFTSPEIAEQFVNNGFVDLGEPTYVKWSELLPSEMGAELYAEVMRLCKSYNPETRLVLYVAVCVVSEVPSSGAVRWERQLVSRCGKIRLDSSCRQPTIPPAITSTTATAQPASRTGTTSPCNITREMDSPETLVLTSMPDSNGQNTPRSSREIGFTNIQRQLRLRGVSLRRHFPQVYTKLCSYVDGSVDKFAPVTIYPRDQASGKSFMCIIMLDAEPERLQLLPTDSSRVRTVDISVEQE